LDRNGCFQLGNQTYYVQKKRHAQLVVIWVDGQKRTLNIHADQILIKSLPIKGLHNRSMDFQEYLDLMCKEAISTWRRALRRTPTYR
jgi:hypothetical protein